MLIPESCDIKILYLVIKQILEIIIMYINIE